MAPSLQSPPGSTDDGGGRWLPLAIAAAAIVVIVAVLFWLSRPAATTQPTQSPYAGNLQLSDIKMSTADNFMGATVTYIEGKVTNAGDKTVTHATVEVTFKNSLDQVVQQERPPLMVRQERPGYSDAVDLAVAPLAPGQSRPFRLTFEHISSDWNGQYPQVKVLTVETK